MVDFSFYTASRIVFGPGRLREIGKHAAALGSRALVVTGRSFLRQTGRLAEIEQCLKHESVGVVVFEQAPAEPTLHIVEAGVAEFRARGCNVVVAVGGGSAIDVGKAVAALATAPGSVREYFRGRRLERRGFPFVAAPTTAGSGAEVTPNAVLIDEVHGVKASIRSPHMLADVVIVDPELTLTLPPEVTAQSGMDAFSQAMEAFVSRGSTPLTDALAEDAVVRLISNLLPAYRDGGNLNLRTEVALGSLMGGMAFANARLGLVHGMAHPLGVITGLPHGLVCALLLPHVIRFNMPVSGAKYARLARSAGICDSCMPDDEAGAALVGATERLNAEMGIEERRSELRVGRETWPAVVEQSLASGSTKSNPRSAAAGDVENILALL
ncbi:MAG TPA: iron-containing alcohol dehydrogenase [Armatimonadota bacterium]|nr:iron-containing alcohol dehydrogenase [Armatimonadota bacterium]